MLIIMLLSGLAVIGSVAWFIALPGYDSGIAILTSLSALLAAWFGDKKLKRQANQNQVVSKNGIGVQAGGNVNMGNIHTSRKTADAE
jgi:hypothetical protein